MRFDQYYSESQAILDAIKSSLQKREEDLMTTFIQQGPEVLRKKMGILRDSDWVLVFDYLVFSSEVLKRCVINFMPFFKHMVLEHGPAVLRKIFDIESSKYDAVFGQIFDLVAVSHGALYDYVYKNREDLSAGIRAGKARGLRKELCLDLQKYDALWEEMLGLLCEAVCWQAYTDQVYDRGLAAFSMLMNGLREHRSLRSYKKMWEYSDKAGE